MTKWQRSLMKENSKVFHLDATHNTCYGIKNTDTVYFFTVVIKNKISGDGAPLAFMLTNAGNAIVIADFLKQLKSRASFNPTQAVTDCDEAETSAIKNALNIPLSWCRYHVRTAFHKQARSKINKGENFISDLEEAKDDFLEILNSPTALEGDDRINKFLDKFKEHKALIKYMPQWFNNRKYIIIGYNDIFVTGASTNNLAEAYHKTLKYKLLKKGVSQRPDVLAFQLLQSVVPYYAAKEFHKIGNYTKRTSDKSEKAAKTRADSLTEKEVSEMTTCISRWQFEVRSFTEQEKNYSVSLQFTGTKINLCTCKAYFNSNTWCKHIFLAQRWVEIYFRDRDRDVFDDGNVHDMVTIDEVFSRVVENESDDEISSISDEFSELEQIEDTVNSSKSRQSKTNILQIIPYKIPRIDCTTSEGTNSNDNYPSDMGNFGHHTTDLCDYHISEKEVNSDEDQNSQNENGSSQESSTATQNNSDSTDAVMAFRGNRVTKTIEESNGSRVERD
ncbi:hypothetical protein JCM33374_g5834 [Metschnikowia sp. JCM 33374]|nr:hypothetical protein JCM33374_g5834 [Metschnikowia sp. JCM 33374]